MIRGLDPDGERPGRQGVLSGLDPNLAFSLDTDSDPAVAEAIAAWLGRIVRNPAR